MKNNKLKSKLKKLIIALLVFYNIDSIVYNWLNQWTIINLTTFNIK